MEVKEKKTYNANFSKDIISDIFSRLPIKSLIRFKCVSKLCNFLITDPDFIDFYHSRSISRPDHRTGLFLRIWGREIFYTIEPMLGHTKACIVPLDNLDGVKYHPEFEYVKGLFCFWSTCFRRAFICNPNTREVRFLPRLNVDTHTSCQCHYSLGFDPNKRRHKVLMTLYGTKKSTRQWVFTLGRSGESWREIKTIPYNFSPLMREGICIDGVIYFFIGCSYTNGSKIEIAKFDVTTEEIRTITLWLDGEYQANIELYFRLIEIEGKLAVVYSKSGTIKFWILQSAETEEWVQKLLDQAVSTNPSSLIYEDDKEEIAIVESPTLISLYNLKKKTRRQIDIEGLEYKDKIIGLYSYDNYLIYSLGRT